MIIASDWKEYGLMDAGDGEKLERWGSFVLRRPDPQAIWPKDGSAPWNLADARYERSREGGGQWVFVQSTLPKQWTVSYRELSFSLELMGFKHTGLFPEQSVNWDWMMQHIRGAGKPVSILNLFAYTGAATVAAAMAGASVCHVDASKGMIERAKENLRLSGLASAPVRFIADDAIKFVERERRRGHVYDAIIMDPPSFGRGPRGEVWKIEEQLFPLLERCVEILAEKPLFFLINTYTTGFSSTVLRNMLTLSMGKKYGGTCSSIELGLVAECRDIILPCGASGRWE